MSLPFENNAEVNGKYLGQISKDFALVSPTLKEASYQLRRRKISEVPIFVCTKDKDIEIGGLLFAGSELAIDWDYRFTFLEELVQRNLIADYKKEEFLINYKDPDEYACLLVIDLDFVNFIYIPYPAEESDLTTLD